MVALLLGSSQSSPFLHLPPVQSMMTLKFVSLSPSLASVSQSAGLGQLINASIHSMAKIKLIIFTLKPLPSTMKATPTSGFHTQRPGLSSLSSHLSVSSITISKFFLNHLKNLLSPSTLPASHSRLPPILTRNIVTVSYFSSCQCSPYPTPTHKLFCVVAKMVFLRPKS